MYMSIINYTPSTKTFGDTSHNRVQGPLRWLRHHQGILVDDHMTCYLISYPYVDLYPSTDRRPLKLDFNMTNNADERREI